MVAIKQIEGRSDDVLRFSDGENKEIAIYPDFIRRAIILSNEAINNYSLVQSKKDELLLYVNHGEQLFEATKQALQHLLLDNGVNDVIILQETELNHQKGNKLRRIRNDYRKTN